MLPHFKEITELLKKGATFEAQEKILELRKVAIELQEENQTLKQHVKELEEKLKFRGNMEYIAPYYWLKNGNTKEGPFCQACYDSGQEKRVRLIGNGNSWHCKICRNRYGSAPIGVRSVPLHKYLQNRR